MTIGLAIPPLTVKNRGGGGGGALIRDRALNRANEYGSYFIFNKMPKYGAI